MRTPKKGGGKMNHSFDVDIAVRYGVNAAILLSNIYFWCQKNMANRHNYFDGSYWTYNSRSAFTVLFPYFSERQIKTALDKLIDDGVIKTGCYNHDPRDRSLWYALTEKGWCMMQKCSEQNAEMSNANSKDVRPLPDTKTSDINADINTDNNTRKRGTFKPPTLEEVTDYAMEKGWTQSEFSAEGFVDFYGSKDWMIGKNKMTDWRKAASGWVTRYRQKNKQQTASVPKPNFMQPQARELTPDEQRAMYEAMENGTFFKDMG